MDGTRRPYEILCPLEPWQSLIFSRASGSTLVMVGPSLRRRVRHSLYRYLQGHSQRYFAGNFAGSLSNRIAEVSMSVNRSVWTVMFDFLAGDRDAFGLCLSCWRRFTSNLHS